MTRMRYILILFVPFESFVPFVLKIFPIICGRFSRAEVTINPSLSRGECIRMPQPLAAYQEELISRISAVRLRINLAEED
jgi:hypothetical protein